MIRFKFFKLGYLCFTIYPNEKGKKRPMIFLSPDKQIRHSTWLIGSKDRRKKAKRRRYLLGHNFEVEGVNTIVADRVERHGF